MLIETLLKPTRKPHRDIDVFGRHYAFKEIVPGRFVAEVTEVRAIEALLKTQKYVEFTDQLPPAKLGLALALNEAPAPIAAAASAPADVTVVNPPAIDIPVGTSTGEADTASNAAAANSAALENTTPTVVDPEKLAAAQSIISVQAKNVGKLALRAEKEVVALALKLEQEAGTPRVSVVETLTNILAKA